MSILSRIMGQPAQPYTAAQPGALPVANQRTDVPSSPYGADPYGADTYAPIAYQVPSRVPAVLPGTVAAYRAMEKMAPHVTTRRVTEYKQVPVEVPIRQPRSTSASSRARTEATIDPTTVETAEQQAQTQAQSQAQTTSRSQRTAAAEAEIGTTTVNKQVKVQKTKVDAKPTLTSRGFVDAVKSSAFVAGLTSIIFNGYAVIKGQRSFAEGGTNVVGDVAAGTVGGAGGVLASSFLTPVLASTFNIAGGLPLTALSFGLGLGGYLLADKLFRKSGFFQSLRQDVFNLLSGNPGAVTNPQAAYAYPVTDPSQVPAQNAYQAPYAQPQLPTEYQP